MSLNKPPDDIVEYLVEVFCKGIYQVVKEQPKAAKMGITTALVSALVVAVILGYKTKNKYELEKNDLIKKNEELLKKLAELEQLCESLKKDHEVEINQLRQWENVAQELEDRIMARLAQRD